MKTTLDNVKKFNMSNKSRMIGSLLDNPKTIQEKLRWLNIYDIPWSDEYSMPLKSVCTDKLIMKKYIQNILGEDVSVPTLFVYNNINEIEWDKLPNKFIIKCNHDSGSTIVCKDKSKFDKANCILKLNKWMSMDFAFRNGFESHYHWIDRKIIVEELLEDENQKDSLYDYKFWCFNGEPKFFTINDGHGHGNINHYKMDKSPYKEIERVDIKPDYSKNYKIPYNFDLMVKYSKKLSKLFKFVRVDFYEVNNKVYLGELTFTPGACVFNYKNPEDNILVGDMLKIN